VGGWEGRDAWICGKERATGTVRGSDVGNPAPALHRRRQHSPACLSATATAL